ncbi:hypothetical protein CFK37_03810 [Virgibacillus phasianinus]|uniref:Uncharacterized protein n=1 Tax=Virgibacillus phasianinus TaxID=2017483 RepID=A0A220TZT6_9BACI|nr:hypothetical protein [Virgibacillus phasianinus]ASK61358.1 hypothetical protein CFK37_03810 [Virgibacillus phasianinus]
MSGRKERGSLVEKDPYKRMFNKFIFLLMIAILTVAMCVWKWTSDEPEKQNPEELFKETTKKEQRMEKMEGLNEEKIKQALEDKNTPKTTHQVDQEKMNVDEKSANTNDLEENYQNAYGKQVVTEAKEQAKKGLALYLLQVSDWEEWKGVVTDAYLKKMKPDIQQAKDQHVKRTIEKMELFASNNPQKNMMTFGVFITWHVTIDGKTTNNPMQLYYITLKQADGKWLISNVVTPNQQAMEGTEGEEKS